MFNFRGLEGDWRGGIGQALACRTGLPGPFQALLSLETNNGNGRGRRIYSRRLYPQRLGQFRRSLRFGSLGKGLLYPDLGYIWRWGPARTLRSCDHGPMDSIIDFWLLWLFQICWGNRRKAVNSHREDISMLLGGTAPPRGFLLLPADGRSRDDV